MKLFTVSYSSLMTMSDPGSSLEIIVRANDANEALERMIHYIQEKYDSEFNSKFTISNVSENATLCFMSSNHGEAMFVREIVLDDTNVFVVSHRNMSPTSQKLHELLNR